MKKQHSWKLLLALLSAVLLLFASCNGDVAETGSDSSNIKDYFNSLKEEPIPDSYKNLVLETDDGVILEFDENGYPILREQANSIKYFGDNNFAIRFNDSMGNPEIFLFITLSTIPERPDGACYIITLKEISPAGEIRFEEEIPCRPPLPMPEWIKGKSYFDQNYKVLYFSMDGIPILPAYSKSRVVEYKVKEDEVAYYINVDCEEYGKVDNYRLSVNKIDDVGNEVYVDWDNPDSIGFEEYDFWHFQKQPLEILKNKTLLDLNFKDSEYVFDKDGRLSVEGYQVFTSYIIPDMDIYPIYTVLKIDENSVITEKIDLDITQSEEGEIETLVMKTRYLPEGPEKDDDFREIYLCDKDLKAPDWIKNTTWKNELLEISFDENGNMISDTPFTLSYYTVSEDNTEYLVATYDDEGKANHLERYWIYNYQKEIPSVNVYIEHMIPQSAPDDYFDLIKVVESAT